MDNHINYFDQAIEDYKRGTTRMQEQLPEMTKGFFHFTEEAFKAGEINQKKQTINGPGDKHLCSR